jgi:thymidylate kinase
VRDRFEEADVAFFSRVETGYQALARAEPGRVCEIDATRSVEEVAVTVLELVSRRCGLRVRPGAGKQT